MQSGLRRVSPKSEIRVEQSSRESLAEFGYPDVTVIVLEVSLVILNS